MNPHFAITTRAKNGVDYIMVDVIRRRLGERAGLRELAILDADDTQVRTAPDHPGCKLVLSRVGDFIYHPRNNTIVG
jgi:hypothetical protein